MATEKVQVNVYLERAIVRRLDQARKLDGFSRSALIGRLVRRYLRKLDEKGAAEDAAKHAAPKATGKK